jgi:hypothetical protein
MRLQNGNFHHPELVGFFRAHAGAIRTASFQLQAATGRGVQRERGAVISPERVWRRIEAGGEQRSSGAHNANRATGISAPTKLLCGPRDGLAGAPNGL